MKRFSASMALGIVGVQAAVLLVSCSWNPFSAPTYEEAKGGGNGGGGSGAGGIGGNGGSGGAVNMPRCGDGMLQPDRGETCDDGQVVPISGDGCSDTCKIEECWECPTEGAACTPLGSGTKCNSTEYCDGAGKCVECVVSSNCSGGTAYCFGNQCFTCSDTVLNGDETDVDCGGLNCAQCNQGGKCNVAGDCKDGNCVDGYCCNSGCSVQCKSCALPGAAGTCSDSFPGTDDSSVTCGAMMVCGTAGDGCKKLPGAVCMGNFECLSAVCTSSKCAKGTMGKPCGDNSHCTSGNCNLTTHNCA